MSTLKVDTILKRTGTGTITLGQSGDTLAVPSGVTIANSGTATGFGGDNTPSFSAYASAAQAVSTDTHTKINFDSEYWDTDSAYDTTNKRFVVPSGEGGKYAIASSIGWLQWSNTSGSLLQDKRIQIQIRINGSGVNIRGLLQTNNSSTQSGQNNLSVSTAGTIELSAGDYIEVFVLHQSGSAVTFSSSSSLGAYFYGYKFATLEVIKKMKQNRNEEKDRKDILLINTI